MELSKLTTGIIAECKHQLEEPAMVRRVGEVPLRTCTSELKEISCRTNSVLPDEQPERPPQAARLALPSILETRTNLALRSLLRARRSDVTKRQKILLRNSPLLVFTVLILKSWSVYLQSILQESRTLFQNKTAQKVYR